MNRRDRLESNIALAMLPVGGTMLVVAVVAAIAVLILVFDTVVQRPLEAEWLFAWSAAALVVAAINARRAIEVMSAFDWRPLKLIGLLSIAIVVAYPGWWM